MYVYIHILEFRLFSSYVTCMYVFRADYLTLNNELMCSSMGKTSSLSRKFLQLPMVLCEGLKPHGLFPIYFGLSNGIILVHFMVGKSCW